MALDFLNIFTSSGSRNPRPPFEGLYIYALLFFVGLLVSDFTTTYFRAKMLPIGAATKVKIGGNNRSRLKKTASIWSSLRDKNIFNADHYLAPTMSEKTQGGEGGEEGESKPVLTSLPLKLIGTIIHGAPTKSVATVQVSGKDIQAVMVDEEIEGMAKIREITRYQVVFRNLRNRKLEYIEIKEENKIRMGVSSNKPSAPVLENTKTNFTFKRSEINKHLENLPRVLQDAKAVPYTAPGASEPSGFKLVAIKAGSIYETLGLKRGDIIKGVNGEPVDTPQKAMELYQALKSSDNIQLEIDRGGSPTTLNYAVE